jgi:hypothetical protein
MPKTTSTNIFNYDFEWYESAINSHKSKFKDECCEKFKKKKEKHCKNCPIN